MLVYCVGTTSATAMVAFVAKSPQIASPLVCDPLFTARSVGNTFLQKGKEFLKRAEFQFATSIDFLDMALELALQRG
jgi:hypothetical protein